MFHETHPWLSRKHMDKYLATQSFRYNERGLPEWEKLQLARHLALRLPKNPDGRQGKEIKKSKQDVFKIDTEGMSFADVIKRVTKSATDKPKPKGKRAER